MDSIKLIAKEFDKTIEQRNLQKVLDFFSKECEIELLGITLKGKEGAKLWITWLFENAPNLRFEPVVIISDGDVFYEEFYVNITLPNGKIIRSHQAETLVFENNLLKSLRIFFNPLDFSDIVAKDPLSKFVINYIKKKSRKGLEK